MGHMYEISQSYVLNERLLFDVVRCRFTDLLGTAGSVTLQPVSVRILSLLVQEPHAVVRRRQLFEDGWRAFGFEVCDNSLNQVMHTLRSAFEAIDPGRPYIRTVPRIGYCLLANVRPAASSDFELDNSSSDEGSRPLTKPNSLPSVMAATNHSCIEPTIRSQECWTGGDQDICSPRSLLLIDVDQLQQINAISGRRSGDDLMCVVEQTIRLQLHRAGDAVVRHCGANFAVRLPETDMAGGMHVANRILHAVQAVVWQGRDGAVTAITVSIGVASSTGSFGIATELAAAAAAALNEGKQVGGNQIRSECVEFVDG